MPLQVWLREAMHCQQSKVSSFFESDPAHRADDFVGLDWSTFDFSDTLHSNSLAGWDPTNVELESPLPGLDYDIFIPDAQFHALGFGVGAGISPQLLNNAAKDPVSSLVGTSQPSDTGITIASSPSTTTVHRSVAHSTPGRATPEAAGTRWRDPRPPNSDASGGAPLIQQDPQQENTTSALQNALLRGSQESMRCEHEGCEDLTFRSRAEWK